MIISDCSIFSFIKGVLNDSEFTKYTNIGDINFRYLHCFSNLLVHVFALSYEVSWLTLSIASTAHFFNCTVFSGS